MQKYSETDMLDFYKLSRQIRIYKARENKIAGKICIQQ